MFFYVFPFVFLIIILIFLEKIYALSDDEVIFDNIWNLVIGRKYLVRASLFDYLHNQITITDNFNFAVFSNLFP